MAFAYHNNVFPSLTLPIELKTCSSCATIRYERDPEPFSSCKNTVRKIPTSLSQLYATQVDSFNLRGK